MSYREITYYPDGTQTEKLVMEIDEYKALRKADLKEECRQSIERIAPDRKQWSASLGVYDRAKTKQIKHWIKRCLDQCNKLERQIDKALTHEQVAAIHWVEPKSMENHVWALSSTIQSLLHQLGLT